MRLRIGIINLLTLTLTGMVTQGCSLFGVRSEENPPYKVLHKDGDREIRQYQAYIVARTTVDGTFDEAQSKGFKILAGYIFGKNKSQKKIAMTAPVVQKKEDSSEKIAMTAPVVMKPGDNKKNSETGPWTMTFSMPSKYSLETLPVPEDDRISIEKVVPKLVAAHIFSGFWNESKIQKLGAELVSWLENKNEYAMASRPMFAGYNPPWTLPFLRHNEILVEIKPAGQKSK